jgi:hypothetical protein
MSINHTRTLNIRHFHQRTKKHIKVIVIKVITYSETFVLVLTVSLVSCLTSSKKLLCKMMKERAILIESCVDDQELA